MQTGTPTQNIENPLFLFPLFGEQLYVLKSDIPADSLNKTSSIESLGSSVNIKSKADEIDTEQLIPNPPVKSKQKVKILNIFPDSVDDTWIDSATIAYEKLMTNLKVGGVGVELLDVSSINLSNSAYLKASIIENTLNIYEEIWSDYLPEYCLVWSDMPLNQPDLKHFSMINFNTCKLIFLPGFNTMLNNPEIKKNTWFTLKQLLGFN